MRRRRTKAEEEHLARGLRAFLEAVEAAPSSAGMSARFLQDMEILTACPVCESPDIARAFLPDAARCHGCGVYFRNPRPTQARIIRAYDAGTTFARWEEEQPVRDRLWRRRLRILVRHAGSGGLLDVGTGDGHFLDFARTRFHVTGTDVSTAAAEYARRRGRHVRLGSLDAQAFTETAFDVITLWHVLEHVAEPGRMLATVRGLLRPGGILVVAVPNEARALAIHRVKRWLGLGARWTPFGALHPAGEIHLTQFVAGTLETAVRRAGFAILESGVDDVNVDDTVMGALDFHVQHLLHRVAGRHLGRAIYMVCRRS